MYSLAPLLKSSSAGLYKALRPLANAYARAAGHRQVGLRYDDLIVEEQEDVQKVSHKVAARTLSPIVANPAGQSRAIESARARNMEDSRVEVCDLRPGFFGVMLSAMVPGVELSQCRQCGDASIATDGTRACWRPAEEYQRSDIWSRTRPACPMELIDTRGTRTDYV